MRGLLLEVAKIRHQLCFDRLIVHTGIGNFEVGKDENIPLSPLRPVVQ